MLSDFYKENESDLIWWTDDLEEVGSYLFSFDKKHIFDLFSDYPYALSDEQLEIFNRENPYWRNFFKGRFETEVK